MGPYKKRGKSLQSQIEEYFEEGNRRGRHINNGQMMNLRFDLQLQKAGNKTDVERYIKKLSQEFDLMLITEHFDESLLLCAGSYQTKRSIKIKIKWNFATVGITEK